MEIASKNRLQFVHHNEIFKTREEAIEYVSNVDYGDKYGRPALFAEPMVLAYGETENPDIILAIGSVGDGETKISTNRTYFIDFSKHSEEIHEISVNTAKTQEQVDVISGLVSNIIEACGLDENGKYVSYDNTIISEADNISDAVNKISDYVIALEKKLTLKSVDSNTIDLDVETDENGTTISGCVKLEDTHTFNGESILKNQIIALENGLFFNARLEYSGNGDTVKLVINDEISSEANIPTEIHLVEGKYVTKTEDLVLTLSDDTEVIVNLSKLAGEVMVDENSKTPITLSMERVVDSESDEFGDEVYHSIIYADVRIADESVVKHNILKIHGEGTTHASLFVDGVASNITYEKKDVSVETELDSLNVAVDTLNEDLNNTNEHLSEVEKFAHDVNDALAEEVENRVKGDAQNTLYVDNVQKSNESLGIKVNVTEDGTFVQGWAIAKDNESNIIKGGGEGGSALYANVELDYSQKTNTLEFKTTALDKQIKTFELNNAKLEYDTVTNTLTYIDTLNVSHKLQLNSTCVFDHIEYKQETEEIVIYYKDLSGVIQEVRIPVHSLIQEWVVDETETLILNKEISVEGKDVLTGEVKISSKRADNILNVDGNNGLYVSNVQITSNTKAIADETKRATDAENALDERLITAESNISNHEDRLDVIEGNEAQEGSIKKTLKDSKNYTDTSINDLSATTHTEIVNETNERKSEVERLEDIIDSNLNKSKKYTDDEVAKITLVGSDAIDITNKVVSLIVNEDENHLEITREGLKTVGIDEAISDALTEAKTHTDNVKTELANALAAETENRENSDNQLKSEISVSVKEVKLIKHKDNELTYDIVYYLNNGQQFTGGTLDIPQDQFIKEVTYQNHTLTIVFVTRDGDKTVNIPLGDLIDVYSAGDGLSLDNNGVFSVNIVDGDKYLTIKDSKLASNGIDEAIKTATDNLQAYSDNTFITKVDSDKKDEDNLKEAKDYSDSLKLNGVNGVNIDYTKGNEVSLKINKDLNTENYLKVNENGLYVSGVDTKVMAEVSTASAKTLSESKIYTNTKVESLSATTKEITDNTNKVVEGHQNILSVLSGNVSTSGSIEYKDAEILKQAKDYADVKTSGITLSGDNKSIVINNNVIKVQLHDDANEYLHCDDNGLYVNGVTEKIAEVSGDTLSKANKYTDDSINPIKTNVDSNTTLLNKLEGNAMVEDSIDYRDAKTLESANTYTNSKIEDLKNHEISTLTSYISNNTNNIATLSGDVATLNGNEAVVGSVKNAIKVSEEYAKTYTNNVKNDLTETINTKANSADVYNRDEVDDKIAEVKSGANWNIDDTSTVDLEKINATLKAYVKISKSNGNIISAYDDGIYAKSSNLTYNTGSNTLTFTNANGVTKDIILNSIDTIKNIYFDGTTNELVFQYTVGGEEKEVKIDAAAFFKGIIGTDEGNVSVTTSITTDKGATAITANLDVNDIIANDNSNVTLTKDSSNKIKANVNIAKNVDNNILVTDGSNNSLYVDGSASNIKYKNGNVENALDTLKETTTSISGEVNTKVSELNNKIDSTKTELTNKIESGDTALDTKINNLNTELTNKVNNLDTELNNKIDDNYTNLDSKITSTKTELINKIESGDTALNTKIDSINVSLTNRINEVDTKIDTTKEILETKIIDTKELLEKEIEEVEKGVQEVGNVLGAIGINEGEGNIFEHIKETTYLYPEGIGNVVGALNKFDSLIANSQNDIDVENTASVELTLDSHNKKSNEKSILKADIKLADLGKVTGTDQDVNLLKIDTDNGGVYFDGNIDCGEY